MKLGTAATAAAFREVLDSDADAIIIATPPEEHADQAIAAIEHGIQRMGQPLVQDIVVDRGADTVAKHVAEVER